MNFWIIAVALLTISAAVISWPILTGSTKERFLGLAILVLMPLAGLLLYQQVGTPDALNMASISTPAHSTQAPTLDQLVAELQQNLEKNPNNPEGWLMLGRSLKSMQRFPEALSALEKADQLLPGTPVIMVELAEAKLFASGNPDMGGEIYQLLQAAIRMEPQQQKGLWLLGMAESQAGNYNAAISLWTTLQGLLDPASGAAQTVAQQVAVARANISGEVSGPAQAQSQTQTQTQAQSQTQAETQTRNQTRQAAATGNAISIDMTLADSLPPPPASAVLFVFVHPAGQRGMPLAAKRVEAPAFPLSISLSDNDTLRPGSTLAAHEKLDISARISMAGDANAASGDYQANSTTVDSDSTSTVLLSFDQRVP